jgi:ABC-2 type transport system permease protein
MVDALRICQAYVARDAAIAMSYRLDLFMRVFSTMALVVVLYFASHLIGDNETLAVYGGYLPFATIGVAMMNFFQVSFRSFASAIRNEQMTGTLEAVIMTPARLPSIVVGSSLWSLFGSMFTVLIYLAAVKLMFGVEFQGSWLAAGFVLGLTSIVFACMGVISASFVMAFKRGDPLPYFVGTLSALLGGVFYPVEMLPGWLQAVSQLLPVTHGIHGLREILLRGTTLGGVQNEIVILTIFIAVTLPLSLMSFNLAVRHARREGSLLVY